MIVVIDADSNSTNERRQQLDVECDQKNIQRKSDNDRTLIFIHRGNIETRLAYLGGKAVDEETRYPKLGRENDCGENAEGLYKMCHEQQKLRQPAPPSIREACTEYRKFTRK